MSEMFFKHSFPFADHPQAGQLRSIVKDSLYGENANPLVEDWSDEAAIFTRSDWPGIYKRLEELGIVLTPADASSLMDFAADYALRVDEELDRAELDVLKKEGEIDE